MNPDLEHETARYLAEAARSPDDPRAHNNVGVIYARQGDPREAIEHFERALRLDPKHLRANMNMGAALVALGRHRDALDLFERVIRIDPNNYGAHAQRGLICANEQRHDEALRHFAATLRLYREPVNESSPNPDELYTTRAKMQHDVEQFRHLARVGIRPELFEDLAASYDELRRSIDWPRDVSELTVLPSPLPASIAETYNRPIHIATCPAVVEGPLAAELDEGRATARFRADDARVAYLDGFLTPRALAALTAFVQESTIWFDFRHIPGHVAAYLETGLASPLLLQIAATARATFPEILGPHPLKQIWAFKNVSRGDRIGLHVDDAAVSLNLWLTVNQGRDAAESGGLTIYRQRLAASRDLDSYGADGEALRQALQESGAQTLTIAYRQNRAILFDSSLYHESTGTNFAPGYENHRVNVTMLFGERTRR